MKYSKKSLGQNFLVDKNIIKKIVNLVDIRDKNIIEIGSGKGALTDEIIKKNPKFFTIIEKDYDLAASLKLRYINNKNIKIYCDDILKFNIEELCLNNSIIFGNLPYNISSQILIKFLKFKKWPPKFNNLVFMFQKELGEKIFGKFPSKNYGRLSIISNFRLKTLKKFTVSPNCFLPKPKVVSQVLHLKPKKNPVIIKDINNLEKVTNILFSNKRKMIKKNLEKILSLKKISMIKNLRLSSRPMELKPEIYYKIVQLYEGK
jgi:16S rRNA (adenine1518-N6/adenine1519-N6)-dimethyltransferase